MTIRPARQRPRFLAPDLDPNAAETRLPQDESRHLTRVLRLEAGALVTVFDGRGHELAAEVRGVRDGQVTLALLEPIEPAAERSIPFTLMPALLKGSSMDDVVRDATMMGAASIQPILTQHMALKPAQAARAAHVERWQRVAIASAKQARRATIPSVHAPLAFERALSDAAGDLLLLFVEPSTGRTARTMRSLLDLPAPSRVTLIIGPEGGWAVEEIEQAEGAGALLTSLGRLTLRAEAAPLVAMGLVSMVWE